MNWPRKRKLKGAGELQRCCYVSMLWGESNQERLIMEALLCGAHLQTHCHAQRIMYVCGEMFNNPAINLLRLVWQVRPCDHLKVSEYLEQSTHGRLAGVWSKIQIGALLDGEFDVCAVVDTDMMAVQHLDEIFQVEVPAAVFRGTNTSNLGTRRPTWTYGKVEGRRKQIGGINGGLLVYKPSKKDFKALMKYLEKYRVPSQGAEQDLMTDFWKYYYERGITALPRSYNVQIHIIMMLGAVQSLDSWYSILVNNPQEQVKNWHFSADPKPVDFMWGSVDVKHMWVSRSSSASTTPMPPCASRTSSASTIKAPRWDKEASSASAAKVPPWASGASSSSTPAAVTVGGRRPNLIQRSKTEDPEEFTKQAAPWKTKHHVGTLTEEMRGRIRDRVNIDADKHVQEAIDKVCRDAYDAWATSMAENVWPNLVFAIHLEIKKRALDNFKCQGCGVEWCFSGENIQHNLFGCQTNLDAFKRFGVEISDAVGTALEKHPFAVPRGATHITQVMQYYGTILEHWEDLTPDRGHIAAVSRDQMRLAMPAEGESALKQHMRTYKNTRRFNQRYM